MKPQRRAVRLAPMSELGQTRTSGRATVRSAVPPRTDIAQHQGHFRKVPIDDIQPLFMQR
jgi:hypothetical protein